MSRIGDANVDDPVSSDDLVDSPRINDIGPTIGSRIGLPSIPLRLSTTSRILQVAPVAMVTK